MILNSISWTNLATYFCIEFDFIFFEPSNFVYVDGIILKFEFWRFQKAEERFQVGTKIFLVVEEGNSEKTLHKLIYDWNISFMINR